MASHFYFYPGKRFWIVQTGWAGLNTLGESWSQGHWHIYSSPKGVNDFLKGQPIVTIYTVDTEIYEPNPVHLSLEKHTQPAQITPIFMGYATDFPGLDKKGNLNKPCESTSNLTSPSVATEKLVTP
jgi:hypothetical protein